MVAGTVWRARRARSGADAGGGAWLACGSVLALLPLAATEPSRRLLGVAAIGVSGTVGVLLAQAAGRVDPRGRRAASIGVAAVLAFIHLAVAPFQTRQLSLDSVEDTIANLAQFGTVPRGARRSIRPSSFARTSA